MNVLLTSERQKKILEILKKQRAVTTSDLVKRFNVSVETVRRDFIAMEKAGSLCRVHGGAVSVGEMKEYYSFEERIAENDELKEELSAVAMNYISDGDIIAVDTGSTAVFFAKALRKRFSNLTVVTHSLDVVSILSKSDGIRVVLCGGEYMKHENSCYGDMVCDALDNLRVHKAFVFPLSVSLGFGLGDNTPELARVQKKLFSSAGEVFVLADSSKFEKTSLYKTSELRGEYTYITDSALSDEIKNLYRENGFNVITKEGM